MHAGRIGSQRLAARLSMAWLLGLAMFSFGTATAGAAWLPAVDLSAPPRDARDPEVGMGGFGETVVIWQRTGVANPFENPVQVSTRGAGLGFSSPLDLSIPAQDPSLAMSSDGEAVAAWWHSETPVLALQVASRPAGGAFGPPQVVATVPTGASPPEVQVEVSDSGAAVVAWVDDVVPESEEEPPPEAVPAVIASVRPPGGSFSEPEIVSLVEKDMLAGSPRVALDPAGNALIVWTYGERPIPPEEPGDPIIVPDREIQAAYRPAASGSFDAPVVASKEAADHGSPDVGMDASGRATVAWLRETGPVTAAELATRSPGGAGEFSSAVPLSSTGGKASELDLEVASSGEAAVAWVWSDLLDSASVMQASLRPAGGGFASPVDVSDSGDNPRNPALAINPGGTVVAAWDGVHGPNRAVWARTRAPGSGFAPPVRLSEADTVFFPDVAIDGQGNATVVWARDNGQNNIIQAAGYDAAPPELRDVSIPAQGTARVPVPFSVSPRDAWTITSTDFSFGDGSSAAGTSVAHAYARAGRYQVTVTAVDATGAPTSASGQIEILPAYEWALGKRKRNRRRGIVMLTVRIGEAGTVTARGSQIKLRARARDGAGSLTIPIVAKGKRLKRLRKSGRVKVGARIGFRPDFGGRTDSRRVRLLLVKKKQRRDGRGHRRRSARSR